MADMYREKRYICDICIRCGKLAEKIEEKSG